MIKIFTIGVYNSTEESFFGKLLENKIDLFCDIRQRRGVRGSRYKYVNNSYLQHKLLKLGIDYLYIKELAPTQEIRQKQKDADKENNETKKMRTSLGHVFADEYSLRILDKFNTDAFVESLKDFGHTNLVFFCVEEYAEACHRSLVAKRLAEKLECRIINL